MNFTRRRTVTLPYEGLCLVDTFEMVEDRQLQLLTLANTARVEKQKASEMFVVIGNPPYNVGQVNENDNNKNRKYKMMDERVRETYSHDSKATNKNALSDPYVKSDSMGIRQNRKRGDCSLCDEQQFPRRCSV